MKFLKNNWPICLIILLAAILRLGGLSWGLPFYFHPDEWNMAAAVTRLSPENKFNPEFFAYGQFPLYLAYFTAKFYNLLPWINLKAIDTTEAIFFLRFWSALASVGVVYLVYLLSSKIFSQRKFLAAALAAFTPSLIQIAHFGTTESILAFSFLGIVFFSFKVLEKPALNNYLLASLFLSFALGSKISGIIFAVPLFLATVIQLLKESTYKNKFKIALSFLFSLTLTLTLTLFFSPYLILNFKESLRILTYEAQVASGQIPVFYTRQFFHTSPFLFQLEKVFPYALGWPIFIFGTLGLFFSIFFIIKSLVKRKIHNFELQLLILNLAFLTYFLSQAFLFCKWTRFLAPIFPFFPIFVAFTLSYLSNLRYLSCLICIIPGLLFSSIYFRPDIRFTASEWIYKNIPSGAKVLSETGNVIDIPILPASYSNYQSLVANYALHPTSFDFYKLDENPELLPRLISYLENSDYIFVPSRRLFVNHLRLSEKFPKTARYYELLFSGKLGFSEIKKVSPFDYSLFPIPYSILDDEQSEETFTVFDHPVIRIYQKTVKLTKEQYENLFQ